MKRTSLKQLLAAVLAMIMSLCVLTGCAKEPQATEPQNATPLPVGTFILTAEASVSVSYDIDGLVVSVEGNNESGVKLCNSYTDYLGKPCADAAKDLIAAAAEAALLADAKNIVIKQVRGAVIPTDYFLTTIENAVKDAAAKANSSAAVTLIDNKKMDEDGYINLETAQALLCNELGVEKLDAYYGLNTPMGGRYTCTAEISGVQTHHTIDAATGSIEETTDEDLMGESPDEDEFISDDDESYEDENQD